VLDGGNHSYCENRGRVFKPPKPASLVVEGEVTTGDVYPGKKQRRKGWWVGELISEQPKVLQKLEKGGARISRKIRKSNRLTRCS